MPGSYAFWKQFEDPGNSCPGPSSCPMCLSLLAQTCLCVVFSKSLKSQTFPTLHSGSTFPKGAPQLLLKTTVLAKLFSVEGTFPPSRGGGPCQNHETVGLGGMHTLKKFIPNVHCFYLFSVVTFNFHLFPNFKQCERWVEILTLMKRGQ